MENYIGIIDARRLFLSNADNNTHVKPTEEVKSKLDTFYCVKYDEANQLSNIRSLYKLDDGIIRVGNPNDSTFAGNMFSEESKDMNNWYNVFDTVDEATMYSDDVFKVTVDKEDRVVLKIKALVKEVKAAINK